MELDWGTVLDAVSSLAILHHKRGPAVVNLAHYQGYPPHWYLWPLVLEEEITITFGDGGSCKSLLALGAAVSLAEEQALLSFEPHGQARTLYLDWEASPGAHAERLRRMVHPGPVPDIPYLRCHAPLHEIVRQVRRHGRSLWPRQELRQVRRQRQDAASGARKSYNNKWISLFPEIACALPLFL